MKLRSVGVLTITVAKQHGVARAVELAMEQGRLLGCWLVIEHGTFAALQTQASLAFDARVMLAHGPPHASHPRSPPMRLTIQFDCVLPASEPDVSGRAGRRRSDAG